MPAVEVRDIRAGEYPAAVALLARGFRDNPLPIAIFGDDPDRRERSLKTMFSELFRVVPLQTPLVALDGETIVGVTGIAPPGSCQPTMGQIARMLPSLLSCGLGSLVRTGRWLGAWGSVDPKAVHSHLGPLAVDANLRGRGIGSHILQDYCRRLDNANLLGYLETETEDNVRLYQRFGFTVIVEQRVVGVPNWFMQRTPKSPIMVPRAFGTEDGLPHG
jgi:ribosomal protein S18 acetylase RimI-like enzyme